MKNCRVCNGRGFVRDRQGEAWDCPACSLDEGVPNAAEAPSSREPAGIDLRDGADSLGSPPPQSVVPSSDDPVWLAHASDGRGGGEQLVFVCVDPEGDWIRDQRESAG